MEMQKSFKLYWFEKFGIYLNEFVFFRVFRVFRGKKYWFLPVPSTHFTETTGEFTFAHIN